MFAELNTFYSAKLSIKGDSNLQQLKWQNQQFSIMVICYRIYIENTMNV